jgi:hypothetical protein
MPLMLFVGGTEHVVEFSDQVTHFERCLDRLVRMHFCPTCGTTVFWEADLRPDHIGVAVGAFHDANFPRPTVSVWEVSKHGWVAFTHDLAHFPTGRPI